MKQYTISDVLNVKLETGDITAPELKTVKHDSPFRETLRKMLELDYSQMGVTKSESLIGVVTYASIGHALRTIDTINITDSKWGDLSTELVAVEADTISGDERLFRLFDILATESYVLVESDDSNKPHIVTDFDVHYFLKRSLEPFLLIEEIELSLRNLFIKTYNDEILSGKLQEVAKKDSRLYKKPMVENCNFSNYSGMLSKNWSDFEHNFSQSRSFTRELIGELKEARNEMFHFRVEDRTNSDLDLIRFAHRYLVDV